MAEQIDFSADFVNVEDITDRVDELREEMDEIIEQDPQGESERMGEVREELATLEGVLNSLKGYGGDHQWEGDWYPQTLIAERAFEGAMDDLIADIGELPKDLPSYLKVSIDYDALRTDYTEDTFCGYAFLYR